MINATKSPLILIDFAIVSSSGLFRGNIESRADLEKKMALYPIEIDFGISQQDNTKTYQILSKIAINFPLNEKEEPKEGYSLFAESVGFFGFDANAELSDKQKQEFLQFSALSICITNMRLYLSNLTSYFPFGKYNFPSIDINALLHDKAEQVINNQNQ
ncbi:hypothetical protein [Paludibacter sp.]|uniref:hypothetical protein n=1 Tax=Paludibacter sp. TaxID=1898105 RepID=UPI001354DE3C|nr:hypothetical protein [Paludibacter sp.]MTK52994.1 hypothetical protein [Paludibacter sp.]